MTSYRFPLSLISVLVVCCQTRVLDNAGELQPAARVRAVHGRLHQRRAREPTRELLDHEADQVVEGQRNSSAQRHHS